MLAFWIGFFKKKKSCDKYVDLDLIISCENLNFGLSNWKAVLTTVKAFIRFFYNKIIALNILFAY
jgi:hypothetical protein